jgi:hypothetical protein
MVPSPRNPLWGEEFNFLVDQLPVEVTANNSFLSAFEISKCCDS